MAILDVCLVLLVFSPLSMCKYSSRDVCEEEGSLLVCTGQGGGVDLIYDTQVERISFKGNTEGITLDLRYAGLVMRIDGHFDCKNIINHKNIITLVSDNKTPQSCSVSVPG